MLDYRSVFRLENPSISRFLDENQTPPRPFSTAVAQASNGVASGMAWVQKSSITAPTKPHCSKLIELFFSAKKKPQKSHEKPQNQHVR